MDTNIKTNENSCQSDNANVFREILPVESSYTLTYNPRSAAAYAKLFATTHNSVFPYWNESGKTNCTNFASQCIWAGFGGSSSTNHLNNSTYPMHPSTSGGSYSYNGWNLTNTSIYSAAWAGTLSIWKYALLQNGFDPNGYTPTSTRWLADIYGKGNENPSAYPNDICTFSNMPNIDYTGAIIIGGWSSSLGNYKHAIVAVSGTNPSNIMVCANSSDFDSKPMFKYQSGNYVIDVSDWSNAHPYIHIIKPTQYIFSTSSTNTVNFRSNYIYGSAGNNLLHSGAEITGKTLYSIIVTIKNSSGSVIFTDSNTNTSHYSFSYSYSSAGRYTITVTYKETSTSTAQTHITYAVIQ